MELTTLLSPLVLSVSLIGVVFFFILWRLDSRRHRHHRLLRRLMNQYIRDHSAKQFSVIVELSRSATVLWPLLEHLSSLDYQQLQVVVVVRHTAGKRALSAVRRYQQTTRGHYTLSVVKHRKGLDRLALVKRYAKGDAVMWLGYDERVSENFFQRLSLEFLDASFDAIAPRRTVELRDTLSSAVAAWHCIARDLHDTFRNAPPALPIMYRRSALLNDTVRVVRNVEEVSLIVPADQEDSSWRLPILYLLPALIVGITASILLPFSWQLVAGAALGATIMMLTLYMTSFSYRATEKLSLTLLLPFWPLVAISVTTLHHVTQHRIRRSKQEAPARVKL